MNHRERFLNVMNYQPVDRMFTACGTGGGRRRMRAGSARGTIRRRSRIIKSIAGGGSGTGSSPIRLSSTPCSKKTSAPYSISIMKASSCASGKTIPSRRCRNSYASRWRRARIFRHFIGNGCSRSCRSGLGGTMCAAVRLSATRVSARRRRGSLGRVLRRAAQPRRSRAAVHAVLRRAGVCG